VSGALERGRADETRDHLDAGLAEVFTARVVRVGVRLREGVVGQVDQQGPGSVVDGEGAVHGS
jgi:hypothetical protein